MTIEKVGRYEIVDELGRGAMGLVYKAIDPNIGRAVALKTMRIDVHGLDSDEMLRRFKNEARAAGVMNHANIVTIYDANEADGLFYIAMEYIEGRTLHSMIQERSDLSTEKIADITRQVCAGLDYAHSMGVIHRDIKPANIMITPQGLLKIMDFGIAKSGGGMTSVGQVLGTPNYMSPEQVKGKPLDGRSDLFSYAVILYEMVTGEKPFIGQNVTTIVYKIVHENPISPRELDVTVHPGLSTVINKALSKSPDSRYQSGAHLAYDIENYKEIGSSTGVISPFSSPKSDAPGEKTVVLPSQTTSATSRIAGSATQAVRSGGTLKTVTVPIKSTAPTQPRRGNGGSDGQVTALLTAKMTTLQKALFGFGYSKVALIVLLAVLTSLVGYRILGHKKPTQSPVQPVTSIPAGDLRNPAADPSPAPEAAAPSNTPAATDTPDPGIAPDVVRTNAARNKVPIVRNKPVPAVVPAVVPTPIFRAGDIHFTSTPAGASVEIDGRADPSWMTPFLAQQLRTGAHQVTFKKQGFAPETRTVEVAAGKIEYDVHLAPAMATLSLNSEPAGAIFEIDGQNSGQTTPADLNVPPGDHKIVIRKDGFRTVNTVLSLHAGQTLGYAPKLMPNEGGKAVSGFRRLFRGGIPEGDGLMDFKTDPPGASVLINGVPIEKATPLRWAILPGDYDVVFSMKGFKPMHRKIHVDKGRSTEIREQLEPR